MAGEVSFIEGGTVTSPKGFSAGATYAGIKTFAEDKMDLGLLVSVKPSEVAGMFTTSTIRSASVAIDQERIASAARFSGLVVNSGIANACVGEQGYTDAQEAAAEAARQLGLQPREMLVGSTGIIGVELPMALIREGVRQIQVKEDGGHELARAIMTTDTFPKEAAVSFDHDGKTVTIGGIAKGSGMIHPNMATMLCYLTTDAQVERGFLNSALKKAVDSSLNMLTVDGDSSTNDTVLFFANGEAGAGPIGPGSPVGDTFQEALTQLCVHLTRLLARDGEGASRILQVVVEGASSEADARAAAKTIASSSLVKSAVHGADPNWGRVMAALGRSGAKVEEAKVSLYINDVCLVWDGVPIPFHRDAVVVLMKGDEVTFRVKLNLGEAQATAWGCSLSEEYVTINSAYTT